MLAVAITAMLWGIDYYRHRFVRSDRDLFRLLPPGDATVFYLNVAALRHAGLLRLLTGAKTAEEADYRSFVRETHFDYERDVDAIAGAVANQQAFFAIRGRFDWSRLRQYAAAHGGDCRGSLCETPATHAGRWLSFQAIQPDVMALALSQQRGAAQTVRPSAQAFRGAIPDRPVWARVSQSVLKNPAGLPLPLRIFAISLQFANPVMLSLSPADEHGEEFKLELDAQCANAAMAETVRNQLDLNTKLLKLELAREHVRPNAADLTGLLTAGAFQVVERRVIATWPVRKELLQSLQ